MNRLELSRPIKAKPLPLQAIVIDADEQERGALAGRFALPAIHALHAEIALSEGSDAILGIGSLQAEIIQNCAISGEEFPVAIAEDITLKFVAELAPDARLPEGGDGAEIELDAEDCDEIEYSGDMFDVGEAVAQSLGLAIDPYAEGPNAETARAAAGIAKEGEQDGPLAEMLTALKKD
ncbi:MAG: DUF177 domain-containing protein [Erythrobacter sp.]